jgi:hypothetical protein
MADWATISSLATASGTLVLAVATFASVRSAKRSTDLSELALREQLRPVLVHSNLDDPVQKIMFGDGRWVSAPGSGAAVEESDGRFYLAISVRNVGAGIGVLQGWYVWPEPHRGRDHVPLEEFRTQQRDFYIPPGGLGIWQGGIYEPSDAFYDRVAAAHHGRNPFMLDLLYTDQAGAQRTISRFSLTATEERWMAGVTLHWHLDSAGPR